ncbi:MAG: sucrose phosphorylase [Acidobacteria bacterium]|nr:sucrose phosphorylase [Acidobacteriota bacterium]
MKNQVQLITYVDRLSGGGFRELNSLLGEQLAGLFGGAHLLPFFTPIDGADAGFDPIDHTKIDPRLGTWEDVKALSGTIELVADLIVNHVSSSSPQFLDFSQRGAASRYAGMFLTFDRVFPEGARASDLLGIYRPRPTLPFSPATLISGERKMLWTTFNPEQVDIDIRHPQAEAYLDSILRKFQAAGIKMIRLDAVGYAVKKPGTSCFMIPETFDYIAELTAKAHSLGIEVLVEIHSHYLKQIDIARRVDWVYDFALPPLVLHALFSGDARQLARWLSISPRNAVTVLDTHDGIGVIDVGADTAVVAGGKEGLLSPGEIDNLVETVHKRSRGQSRKATGAAASNLDLYQVNCTFLDALGGRETDYLIARALQFFAPGIPQVYYVGLLGGSNDMELLARTGVGRDINRHYYTVAEIEAELRRPLVQKQLELIRLRNTHPAFAGEFQVNAPAESRIELQWKRQEHRANLHVDFSIPRASITCTGLTGEMEHTFIPEAAGRLKDSKAPGLKEI